MIALLQRVAQARVEVDGAVVGEIGRGLLVFLCAERADTEREGAQLLRKLMSFRVFADDAGRMNRSLADLGAAQAGLLIVPQFTLAADTGSGTRPSFTPAASPQEGRRLFEAFARLAGAGFANVRTGEFGANMQVHLINDGPVTFWLRVAPSSPEIA